MNRRFSMTGLSLAISATLFLGQSAIAQCDSGGCGTNFGTNHGTTYVDGQVMNSAFGGGASFSRGCGFGYPASNGCGTDIGGRHGGIKGHVHHLAEINKRDFARNQAWPMPFDCADRQLYHCIWNTMVDSGVRCNCVFSAKHFDPDTNELNDAGIAKLRGIYRNAPLDQKIALVQNEGSSSVVDMRLSNIQNVIDKWYGSNSFVEVARTDLFPGSFAGSRAETINEQYFSQTPPPIIPVASGTGSTSNVGVGN